MKRPLCVTNVAAVLQALEQIAPSRFAFSFDKIGLQVGDSLAEVSSAVVSLDRSLAAIDHCASVGAELLVAHHPLIFEPLPNVTCQTHVGQAVLAMAHEQISFIATHTNWDSAIGGINDALANSLGLADVSCFGSAASVDQRKMVVFAPESHVDVVISAASNAGAGVIGDYRRCAFHSSGTGMFEAAERSRPFSLSGGIEHRIEMILPSEIQSRVERAVREVHPYETPAIDFLLVCAKGEQPAGRMGTVKRTRLRDFVHHINGQLETRSWVWGDPDAVIETVAVVGGAADSEWKNAQRAGAQVFVTGEVKQHIALEAVESGLAIIAAGHYATEQPGVIELRNRLAQTVPLVDWHVFTPEAGAAGRPWT
ncbi:MAG: Nif3-like dinuclear metal center hexameric protein [Fimbriimonadaceae bacterium]